ncbi:MAG: class I SAM-dependent methyltransferase [Polyangiaceae bacterium]|nr:class I SAM-dependent methyltransferase [Polyangiaceae bacterium]
MLRLSDVRRLSCPSCRAPLTFHGDSDASGRLARGALSCEGACPRWIVEDGLARLYREELVRGKDRLLRHIYDNLPWAHDPFVRTSFPLFQVGTEEEFRDAYMPRLELGALRPREDGEPVRILEIAMGCGANLPLVRRDLPAALPVEIWGCDLSLGMLGVLRRRLRREGDDEVRVLACDAHALPFPDGAFDRVFHVGAMNSYRDPRTALAEMARVAAPGTPIVVVDEQLDPTKDHGLFHRAMFRLVTFYDPDPRCPIEHLPAGAEAVTQDQLGVFFYCLTFRMSGLTVRMSGADPGPTRGRPGGRPDSG